MGGCQSSAARIGEAAGAFALAGVAAASGAEGAAGLAGGIGFGFALGGKKGCHKTPEALVQSTNEIIASAIIKSSNKCNQQSDILQDITIECQPNLTGADIRVWEENRACRQCVNAVFQGMLSHHALERRTWIKDAADQVRVRLPIDEEYGLMLQRLELCGITQCKACALTNVTQANVLSKDDTDCYSKLQDASQFSLNLRSLLRESFLNNQDVLSGASQALGKKGVESLTEEVATRIESQVNENFLISVTSLMQSQQVLSLKSSTTLNANNISQQNAFNIALTQVQNSNVTLNVIDQSVFNFIASVSNQQNTLNSVGETVFEATVDIAQALEGVVTRIMFAALALLAATVLVLLGYGFYRGVKSLWNGQSDDKSTAVSSATYR